VLVLLLLLLLLLLRLLLLLLLLLRLRRHHWLRRHPVVLLPPATPQLRAPRVPALCGAAQLQAAGGVGPLQPGSTVWLPVGKAPPPARARRRATPEPPALHLLPCSACALCLPC
jgi:hypothetical protein